jgi:hypothetical protein
MVIYSCHRDSLHNGQAELASDPQNVLRKYRVVFAEGGGVSRPLEKTLGWRHGKQVLNVEDWLRQNLKNSGSEDLSAAPLRLGDAIVFSKGKRTAGNGGR